eukprot:1184523-Prorocentrum_minimum.AAC.3
MDGWRARWMRGWHNATYFSVSSEILEDIPYRCYHKRRMGNLAGAVDVSTTAVDVSTTAVDVSTTSVDVSTTAVDVSTTSVDVSTTAVDVCSTSVDVSTTAVDVSTTSVDVSSTAVYVSDVTGGRVDVTGSYLEPLLVGGGLGGGKHLHEVLRPDRVLAVGAGQVAVEGHRVELQPINQPDSVHVSTEEKKSSNASIPCQH